MTNTKRDVVDDIVDGVRQVLEEFDRLLRPEKRPKPAPVPVPVRSRPGNTLPPRDPYR